LRWASQGFIQPICLPGLPRILPSGTKRKTQKPGENALQQASNKTIQEATLHRHPAGQAGVRKKLDAGQPGTQRYLRQFGESLVCVRYRHHADGRRYTTVEIVVDERHSLPMTRHPPLPPDAMVAVRIEYADADLRTRAKAAGARWDADRKAWLMNMETAYRLGLKDRITGLVK
jgi:hypothetical protein